MVRKNIPLVLPFRYIKKSDARQSFDNELLPINNIDLNFLIDKNKRDQYVVVYDYNRLVAAFIVFRDIGTHFYVVYVETNRVHNTGLNPGRRLIDYVETISPQYDYKKVVLDSTLQMISYYESLGYRKTRFIQPDLHFVTLTRMEKLL